MINLSNFTRTLTAFCLVLFIYLFLPDSLSNLGPILKYVLLVGIIVLLMMYNQFLSNYSDTPETSSNKSQRSETTPSITNTSTTTSQYDKLQSIVLNTITSINNKFVPAIYMVDPVAGVFSLQNDNATGFNPSFPTQNKIITTSISSGQVSYQKDSVDSWDEILIQQKWRGSECLVGSPIHLHGAVGGFILILVNHFSDLTDSDKIILKKLGDYISYGLENLEALETHVVGEEHKTRILEVLSKLNFRSDENEILSHFKYLIRSFVPYDRLTIAIKNESGNSAYVKLVDGIEDELEVGTSFSIHGTVMGFPISSGESIQSQNWKEQYPNLNRYSADETETSFQSILGVPVFIQGENVGTIFLERLTEQPYNSNNADTLKLISRVLGSSLYWVMEYEKIYNDATHDGLSNLLNHQTFKERFSEEILRAKRFQHHMSILIFDLDKFKRINDTISHQYGDYVIKTVANIMTENVRAIDVVARYGGEEFAIILVNSPNQMAKIVAQRIVDSIASYPFSMDGKEVKMTISAGMSEFPTHSEDMKDLIDYADKSMYDTKEKGGNGVTVFHVEDTQTDT